MKTRTWSSGLAVWLFFAAGQAWADSAPPQKNAAPKGRAECHKDQDCVMVPVDCCGCTAGGKQRAVPRSSQDRIEREQARRCRETACVDVMSSDPSCSAAPRCAQGRCEPR